MGFFSNYEKFKDNVYSQFGEDGILREILTELNIENGSCIEFGAADGPFCSNTFNLLDKGWQALYIEFEDSLYEELLLNTKKFENVTTVHRFVEYKEGPNDLNSIVEEYNFEQDCEILSIDIDSEDLRVWSSYKGTPKIIIIEINSKLKPGIENYHKEKFNGNSFTSTLKVGINKGYTLVCHTGNMIFIRNDLIEKSRIGKYYTLFPSRLFTDFSDRPYWKSYIIYKYNKYIKRIYKEKSTNPKKENNI